MAIISNLDRRTARGKWMLGLIYAGLFLGGIFMVYPFLLMVRMATVDHVDRASISPWPEFLTDADQRARKYLLGQYHFVAGWQVAAVYQETGWTSMSRAEGIWERRLQPLQAVPREKLQQRVGDLEAFAETLPPWMVQPVLRYRPGEDFEDRFISNWLMKVRGRRDDRFRYFEPIRPDWARGDWTPPEKEDWRLWQSWLAQLPASDRFVPSAHACWQRFLRQRYQGNLEGLRQAHGLPYEDFFRGPRMTSRHPGAQAALALRQDWEDFVRQSYPLLWQRLREEARPRWQQAWRIWLEKKAAVGSAQEWESRTGLSAAEGWDLVPAEMPAHESAARWWAGFVQQHVPWMDREILVMEERFADYLRVRYGNLQSINRAWGSEFTAWEEVHLPLREADYLVLTAHPWKLRGELLVKNYRTVLKALLWEGQAFTNTFWIVILSVITSLTINPLAAYALSRFRLRATNKVLIFLLATMALPGEVALVPGFLLVRDLHLTDTFWALVLPTAANAFSIFLLKGFFDSLPQELYEAALIDGAGEFSMFTRITIPLSMPIIAVTLLGTVTHAYNLFMPAVMYLGDVSKWPLATKIYEINQSSSPGVGMAALVVSSLFPLLVFIFCQRIIMRGIILPSMK